MLKTKIPPPIYMLIFAGSMYLLDKYIPIYFWLLSPWNRIGFVVVGVSGLFDAWSLMLFFIAKTTLNPMTPSKTSSLVTTGLYRISRNPMYLGLLIILFGWALHLGSVSPLLVLPAFVFVLNKLQIEPEEIILAAKFGQQYMDYQRQVRRWI